MKVNSMELSLGVGLEHSRYVPVNMCGTIHNELAVIAYNIKSEEPETPKKDPFSHSSVGFGSISSSGASSGRRSRPTSGFYACHAAPTTPVTYLHPNQLADRINQYFHDQALHNRAEVKVSNNGSTPFNLALCLDDVDPTILIDDLSKRTTVEGIVIIKPGPGFLEYARKKGIAVIGIDY